MMLYTHMRLKDGLSAGRIEEEEMRKGTERVEFVASQTLSWPHFCVLCLSPATEEVSTLIGGCRIPYCDPCYAKVQRLRSWKDGLFMVSLIIGLIGAVAGLVAGIVQQGWMMLFRMQSWFAVILVGLLLVGVAYALLWIAILPLRLVLRARLADPGVKLLKSKKPGITAIRFSNPQYADAFREANSLPLPGAQG